jgi:enamine deaminase RidA (YjgF/YER057c/UK114 family)
MGIASDAIGTIASAADVSSAASAAVRGGPLLFVSGQVAVDESGTVSSPGDAAGQARRVFDRISRILLEHGATTDAVVDVLASFLDVRDADAVLDVASEYFHSDFPAWTIVGTQCHWQLGALVQIHVVAHLGEQPKQCVTPDSIAWMRQHPMSAACRKGDYVFVGGQMPIDAEGNVVNAHDHSGQARFLFNRISEVVQACGGNFRDDVLDILTFSIDPRSFLPMCQVKNAEFLTMPTTQAPCSSIISATSLYKHLVFHCVRAWCEVGNGRAVAYTPGSLFWRNLPVSGGTKKQYGKLLCVAGEVGMDLDGQIITPGDPAAQARYAFNRIKEVVEMAGGTMNDVVDLISFHKDARAIDRVMEVSREFFERPPAWTALGYPGGYFEGHLHEILARAWID